MIEIGERDGIPVADWAALRSATDNMREVDRLRAWSEAQRAWMEAYADLLGGTYAVLAGPRFLILSPGTSQDANALHRACENSLSTAIGQLEGIGEDRRWGKHLVLAFRNESDYYTHVDRFEQSEGRRGGSAGCWITHEGIAHIALASAQLFHCETVIAHELTHALLRHLGLPLWLEESLTQRVELSATKSSAGQLLAENIQEQRRYWPRRMLADFWQGTSFSESGRGQRLSYQLALMLFQLILERFGKRTRAFAANAYYVDAGEAAANEHLGASLADVAETALGPGDWAVPTFLDAPSREPDTTWLPPVVKSTATRRRWWSWLTGA